MTIGIRQDLIRPMILPAQEERMARAVLLGSGILYSLLYVGGTNGCGLFLGSGRGPVPRVF